MIVRKVDQLKPIHWSNMVLFGGIIATMYLIALLFLLVFDELRLGSTSYITDIFISLMILFYIGIRCTLWGTPVQYIEYLPFGEGMVEQSTNNILENVYKFNAFRSKKRWALYERTARSAVGYTNRRRRFTETSKNNNEEVNWLLLLWSTLLWSGSECVFECGPVSGEISGY